jgi:hypothetical protein
LTVQGWRGGGAALDKTARRHPPSQLRSRAAIRASTHTFKAQGPYEGTHAVAIKRVLAWQIEEAMKKDAVSKTEMALRMNTSRSQLDRLLDPKNDAASLEMLARAAHALGRNLKLELV